jgi:Tfp pilus assembly protein PilO
MLQRISGRVALLIIVVVVLFVLVIGWSAFVSPQRSKASALDAQISDTQLQIVDNQKLLAGPTRRESLAAVRKVTAAMPDQPQQSQLVRQLSAIAKTSEVQLSSITPGSPVVGITDESLPLAVTVNGHYFAIQRFLRLLRASADLRHGKLVGNGRLYSVDSIGFAAASGTTGSTVGVITATLAINAYQNLGVAAAVAAATAAASATTTTTTTTPASSASGTPAAGQ